MSSSLDSAIELHQTGFLNNAQEQYENIIKFDPNNFQAIHLLGVIFFQKKNYLKSIKLINKSININPNNFSAYNNLGNVFRELKKYADAIKAYNKAIEINPNYTGCLYNIAKTYTSTSNYKLALIFYEKTIASDRNFLDAYYDYAELLENLGKYNESLETYYKLLKLNPDYPYLKGSIVNLKLKICKWENLGEDIKDIENNIIKKQAVNPFHVLLITDSPKLQKIAIEKYSQHKFPPFNSTFINSANNKKIKIGYYCADFSDHPMGRITPELFENHNKNIFEIYGFYFGAINDSLTSRISNSFHKFINVFTKSDIEIVDLSRNLGIDIAVDLNGFTKNCRPNIFAYRCAPLQISYLAYPATMGCGYIDYIIADKILIPEDHQKYFTEKIIYLPKSYQVSDQKRSISKKIIYKKDFNLPEDKFIFCCFNNVTKINPEIFEIWMKILKKNQESILWLLSDNKNVIYNLKLEAEKRGIKKDRLIFCNKLTNEDHLARYKLADLFLDTIPYNAHVTANDALWCGVPVLTLIGASFASRVGASILNALNMKELIAHSKTEFEDIASSIYKDPKKFKSIKQKLLNNKINTTFFNTKLYTKNLELAYLDIYKKNKKNLKPENIYIK
jgi:predicted O-linked N-acetylglucosamine transferase (SPINDLY family)